jgi:DNA-3-methyladenine glycosylase
MKLSRRRLGRAFFARPAPEVARDLLGRVLVRTMEDRRRIAGRIVETEAYTQDDAASHSHRGPTARNAAMFEQAGTLYVYSIYGMHLCMNAVTGEVGEGSAVLLRALEPLEGLEIMARNRGKADPRLFCSGPARLCQAFGLTTSDDLVDLVRDDSFSIEAGSTFDDPDVAATRRIGIRTAVDLPRRYVVVSSEWVSHPPVNR